MMKSNLLITLTALTLTICTSNLHALTKTRAFAKAATTAASTAANYARNNKLKTTGIAIGGALVLDVLQAKFRRSYHESKLPAAKKLSQTKGAASDAAWKKYLAVNPSRFGSAAKNTPTEEEMKKIEEARGAWQTLGNEFNAALDAYSLALQKSKRPTFLYQAYSKISHKIKKICGK